MKSLRYLGTITFLFSLLANPSQVWSDRVDLRITTTQGKEVLLPWPSTKKYLVLADNSLEGHQIARIENLGEFPQVESIEIYNISSITDYSFLADAVSLRSLHMSCNIFDLQFLGKLPKLEYLSIDVVDRQGAGLRTKPVDLQNLKNLDFIVFSSPDFHAVPPFIGVQNKPYINLDNAPLTTLSDRDVELLKQYSTISFRFNPISKLPNERQKLRSMQVLYSQDEKMPEKYWKYLPPYDYFKFLK